MTPPNQKVFVFLGFEIVLLPPPFLLGQKARQTGAVQEVLRPSSCMHVSVQPGQRGDMVGCLEHSLLLSGCVASLPSDPCILICPVR